MRPIGQRNRRNIPFPRCAVGMLLLVATSLTHLILLGLHFNHSPFTTDEYWTTRVLDGEAVALPAEDDAEFTPAMHHQV